MQVGSWRCRSWHTHATTVSCGPRALAVSRQTRNCMLRTITGADDKRLNFAIDGRQLQRFLHVASGDIQHANHLEWNRRNANRGISGFSPFLTRLKVRILPFAGIAFPVRLGNVGNGYVVFTANYFGSE